jgi:hypothetical protein
VDVVQNGSCWVEFFKESERLAIKLRRIRAEKAEAAKVEAVIEKQTNQDAKKS